MRTLTELAETYEQWAAEAEALANHMMAGLSTQRKEIHARRLQSAQIFLGEADQLRQVAARLRKGRRPQPILREKDQISLLSQ